MNEAITLAIEKGGYKRDYMRKPQEWILGHYADNNYNYAHILSKGKLFTVWVSLIDIEKVKSYRWYLKDGYAVTSIGYKKIKMHHLLLGKPIRGKEIDHINRNRLDNRKSNLRFVSSSVNGQNIQCGWYKETW